MIKLFSHIDPSWYDTSPFLQSLLEERWQDGITHHFLQYFFHQSFPGVYPSPKEQIPPHPLGMLADATKPELESLLFYLGLYDLAAEQKMILDGSILRAIEKALTPEERLFMKEITPHSLGLMGIAKSPSQVRSLVLRRGIERLSYGLADAPPRSCLVHSPHPRQSNSRDDETCTKSKIY